MTQNANTHNSRFDRMAAIAAAIVTLALLVLGIWPLSGSEAPDSVLFLGRFHFLLVHLPIGFLAALLVLELLDLFVKSAVLHHGTYVVAWLAAGAALLAALAGVLLAYPGEYSEELLFRHRWLGLLTAVCTTWILAWKISRSPREDHGLSPVYHPMLVITAALLVGAGHYGGSLTHGSDYLTAYMPNSMRTFIGLPQRAAAAPVAAEEDPRDLVVFRTLVEPILKNSCVSCHGQEKQKNGLRLDSYEALIEGGESGADLDLIVKSLRLPIDHDGHMPPKNKPQLSSDEIALIAWWIQAGASDQARIGDLQMTGQIERVLQARFDLPPEEEAVPMQEWTEIEEVVKKLSTELKVGILQASRDNPALEISFIPPDAEFGDAEVARLSPLQANLQSLNLSGTEVTDEGLAHVAAMENLLRLNLSNTAVSDIGLAYLSELSRLRYLNLYGTRVTDAGLDHLRGISSLRNVYLWQTEVTPDGVAQLQNNLTDESQVESWRAQIAELRQLIESSEVEVNLGDTEILPATTEEENSPYEETAAADPINEECPVSGRAVDPTKTAMHGDVVIGFCCGDCLAEFKEDPEPILAKLNLGEEEAPPEGRAAADLINEECPVSGRAVDPTKTAMHGDVVIGFCCGDCLAEFKEDPEPILAKLNLEKEE